jgi:hypothetical protein
VEVLKEKLILILNKLKKKYVESGVQDKINLIFSKQLINFQNEKIKLLQEEGELSKLSESSELSKSSELSNQEENESSKDTDKGDNESSKGKDNDMPKELKEMKKNIFQGCSILSWS